MLSDVCFHVPADLCSLSSSGKRMLVYQINEMELQCFDLTGDTPRPTFSLERCVVAIFHSNEDQVIAVGESGEMEVYDASDGTKQKTLGMTHLDEIGFTPHPTLPVMAKTGDSFRSIQIRSMETALSCVTSRNSRWRQAV